MSTHRVFGLRLFVSRELSSFKVPFTLARRGLFGPQTSDKVRSSFSRHELSAARQFTAPRRSRSEAVSNAGRMEEYLSPVQAREDLRSRTGCEIFKVTGVSFEGRQEVIANLKNGEAITLERELDNPYDPHAVAVKLLDGQKIGYVPRNINQSGTFSRLVSFGHVESVGAAADGGLFGLTVVHQPTVLPLVAEPIPQQLRAVCRYLPASLQENKIWKEYQASVFEEANHTCLISGSKLEPPEVCPVWRSDRVARKIVLDSLTCLAPQVQQAQDLLLQEGLLDREAGLVFQAMNGWTIDELTKYRERQQRIAKKRSDGSWKLDLSLLITNSIAVPQELQQHLWQCAE